MLKLISCNIYEDFTRKLYKHVHIPWIPLQKSPEVPLGLGLEGLLPSECQDVSLQKNEEGKIFFLFFISVKSLISGSEIV